MADLDNEAQEVNEMFKKASELAKEKRAVEKTKEVQPAPAEQDSENYDPLTGNTFDYFKPDE